MSTPPDAPGLDLATIVTRLRAAGCVFAEDEADLLLSSAASPTELRGMVARRVDGLPLEHVVGWAEFCGLRVAVAPGVFVPRPRTELMVRQAVAIVGGRDATVVDLCCGSGAIGLAVASASDGLHLYATDLDPAAVACARRNVEPIGGEVCAGDLFTALPRHLRGAVDVLVANVPYVPTDAIRLLPPEARLHEPRLALDGGADGLDLLRRVAAGAPDWLTSDGRLLVETSARQAATAVRVLAAAGLSAEVVTDEDLEATLVVAARATGSGGLRRA
jgi:release factor glutamine methyltransferase